MESNLARWRGDIQAWLIRLGYVLAVEEITSSIQRQMICWGYDLEPMDGEIRRTGRMTRHQKRASWDGIRYVLYMDPSDTRRERGGMTVPLRFDPAAAEIDADPALQQHQKALEDRLEAAMKRLPARLRKLVVGRVKKGKTFKDLASETGMSAGHMHGQFNMAIAMLKRAIDESRNKNPRA